MCFLPFVSCLQSFAAFSFVLAFRRFLVFGCVFCPLFPVLSCFAPSGFFRSSVGFLSLDVFSALCFLSSVVSCLQSFSCLQSASCLRLCFLPFVSCLKSFPAFCLFQVFSRFLSSVVFFCPLFPVLSRFLSSVVFSARSSSYPTALSLVESGAIDIAPLITHHFSLSETVRAFQTAVTPESKAVKVMIHCDQ